MPKSDYDQELARIDAATLGEEPQAGVELARAALEKWPDNLKLLRRLGVALEAAGRRDEAIAVLVEANKAAVPGTADIQAVAELKFYLAICLQPTGAYRRVAELAEEVIGLGVRGASIFALAGTARHRLGQKDLAVKWGAQALEMRDEAARTNAQAGQLPSRERKRPFDPSRPERNVIAYSLFGRDDYYFDCALANARIAMASFPDFRPRYYCSHEVPGSVLDELRELGSEVQLVEQGSSRWEGLFWRFWAFDDPEADVVLVRDVDSPLTARERVAVEDWLYNSDAPFHVLRDLPTHTNPIMAGLWGGFTGLLPPLAPLSKSFLEGRSYRYADQSFLNQHVWPLIREACLAHDSNYELLETRAFPPWGRVTGGVHVGWAWPGTAKSGRSAF